MTILQHKREHKRLRLFWQRFALGGGPTSWDCNVSWSNPIFLAISTLWLHYNSETWSSCHLILTGNGENTHLLHNNGRKTLFKAENYYLHLQVGGVCHTLLCRLRNLIGKQFARIYPDRRHTGNNKLARPHWIQKTGLKYTFTNYTHLERMN